jgi:DNA-binding XRE family transcriptional regulator
MTVHPLRTWRRTHGLTLADLAAEVDVSTHCIALIETWQRFPSWPLAARIKALTGLSMDEFLPPADGVVTAAPWRMRRLAVRPFTSDNADSRK